MGAAGTNQPCSRAGFDQEPFFSGRMCTILPVQTCTFTIFANQSFLYSVEFICVWQTLWGMWPQNSWQNGWGQDYEMSNDSSVFVFAACWNLDVLGKSRKEHGEAVTVSSMDLSLNFSNLKFHPVSRKPLGKGTKWAGKPKDREIGNCRNKYSTLVMGRGSSNDARDHFLKQNFFNSCKKTCLRFPPRACISQPVLLHPKSWRYKREKHQNMWT